MYLRAVQINVKDKAVCFQYCNSLTYSFNNDSEADLSYITFNYTMNMLHAKPWIKKINSAATKSVKGFLLLSCILYLEVSSSASLLQSYA